MADCEPDDWLDDRCKVRKSEVAKMFALFVGVLRPGDIPDVAIYAQTLIDDVVAANPPFAALECTCRKIRKQQEFLPSICSFAAELERETEAWGRALRDDQLHRGVLLGPIGTGGQG